MTSRAFAPLPGGYTPESWEYAKAFVLSLGKFPSTFTSVVRLLLSDHDKNANSLSDYGTFFVSRLLRAPSLRAVYFYAIREVRAHRIGDRQTPFPAAEFVRSFSGYEHAILLSSVFTVKLCRRQSDPAVFGLVTPRLGRSTSIGWYIGEAIPAIGPANGVLGTAFRVLGLLPFIKHDPQKFGEYWNYLHTNQLANDFDYEYQAWRCNSLQIAALLSQQLGFGLERAVQLMRALTSVSPTLPKDELERCFRVTDLWFQTILENRTTPTIPLPPKYYPNKVALDQLMQRYTALLASQQPHWITATKEDLSPEKTPQLYIGDPPAMSVEEEKEPEVPQELKESLTGEALNELSSKLLEDVMTSSDD